MVYIIELKIAFVLFYALYFRRRRRNFSVKIVTPSISEADKNKIMKKS